MRQIIISFLILASLFAMFPAQAGPTGKKAEQFPQGDFSDLRGSGTSKVTQIIDPLTIALDDKRIIQLTGIDYPDLAVYNVGDFAVTAKKVLTDMLTDQSVTLYLTQEEDWGRSDRMGHVLAHMERASDKAWVQGVLISLGLARVRTTQRNPEMAEQLYALEDKARKEKLGIWSNDTYKVLTPEETETHLHSFQIVEGKIESVALKGNRIFLNFGKDWKKDFTVSISPEDKRLFTQAGMDPMDWGSKTARIRGWIRAYNGPYMEIDHPGAVELQETP